MLIAATDSSDSSRTACTTVKVGTDPKVQYFDIYDDRIKDRGGAFLAAVHREWKGGIFRRLHLPDVDLRFAKFYLRWINGQDDFNVTPEFLTKHEVDKLYFGHARLYVLGEKFQDAAFCNYVMEDMTRTASVKAKEGNIWYPHAPQTVAVIYEGTPVGSPARQFLVDCVKQRASGDTKTWFTCDANEYSPEFLLDSARALMSRQISSQEGTMQEQRAKWMKEE